MSGSICPRCGTARLQPGSDCLCAAAGRDTEPFEETWVRPYLGGPPPCEVPPDTPAHPWAGESTSAPGPVRGIMQARTSLRQDEGRVTDHRDSGRDSGHRDSGPRETPSEGLLTPHRPTARLAGPRDSPASPAPDAADDDTVVLRLVGTRHTADPPTAPWEGTGPRRLRRRSAGAQHPTGRSRGAKVAGAAALLAAVAGTTALAGVLVGAGGPAQRVAPEATSSAHSVPKPTTPPTPAGSPRQETDEEEDAVAGAAPSAPNSPTWSRPTATPPDATPPAPTPTTAPSGRSAEECLVPRLPGAPCPTGGERHSLPPEGRSTGLCCGASGPEVADLQFRLRWLDLYGGRLNGTYNQRLTDSVLAYQQSRGITSDLPGQYGPATRAALQREVPDIVSD